MVVTGFCAPRSRGSLRALILRAAFVVGVATATALGVHATASAAQSEASERVEQARESHEDQATATSSHPAPDSPPTSPEHDPSAPPTGPEPSDDARPEPADLVEQTIDEHAAQQPESAEPDDSPAPDGQPNSDEPASGSAPIVEAERIVQVVPAGGAATVAQERTAQPDRVSTAVDTDASPPAPEHGPTHRVTGNDHVTPPPPAEGNTEPTYPLPGQPNAPPTSLTAPSTASGLGNGGKGLHAVLPAKIFVPTAGPPAHLAHADAHVLFGSVTTGPSVSPD